MKRLILSLALVVATVMGLSASGKYAHDASVLPEAARATIAANFKAKVSVVKIDKDFGRISEYEAVLSDGSEIDFDRAGNWKSVETNRAVSVPSGFVAEPIKEFVRSKHPGTKIVGVEKKRGGYEIDLSNGIDIRFDAEGQFVRYDD